MKKIIFLLTAVISLFLAGCSPTPKPDTIYVDRNVTVEIPTKCVHTKCALSPILDYKDPNVTYLESGKILMNNYLNYQEFSLCLQDSIKRCEQ